MRMIFNIVGRIISSLLGLLLVLMGGVWILQAYNIAFNGPMGAGGQRTCSACPPDFVGDGLNGCIPQLRSLLPSCGTLSPLLVSGVYKYRLDVPLLCQRLQLTAR